MNVRDAFKRIAITSVVVYGATLAACFFTPYGYITVGSWIKKQGSVERVVENFRHPIESIRPLSDGDHWYTSDGNPAWENLIGHPGMWCLLGLFLRTRGHGRLSSFIQGMIHSFMWEYVIEGCYTRPSGVDLITNTAGILIALVFFDWSVKMGRSANRVVRVLSYVLNPYKGPAILLGRLWRALRVSRASAAS